MLLVLTLGACNDSVTGLDTTTDDLIGAWNLTSLTCLPAGGGTSVEGLVGSAMATFHEDLTYTLIFTEWSRSWVPCDQRLLMTPNS